MSGIKRLLHLQAIAEGKLTGTKPIPGAQKSISVIQLNLTSSDGLAPGELPIADPDFQTSIDKLFPQLNESYSIAVLDITAGRPMRYAHKKGDRGFQPGSVGKLAVAIGFMTEIQKIYPNSFEKRQELMRSRRVKSGPWGMTDSHTVPFYTPETQKLVKRTVQPADVFSLYEWLDHMLSVSNNGAASIVWREAMLMRHCGAEYPELTEKDAEAFFSNTPKQQLTELSLAGL